MTIETPPSTEALTPEEETTLRTGIRRIFRDYVPTGEDVTIRRLLATLDAERATIVRLRTALKVISDGHPDGCRGAVIVARQEAADTRPTSQMNSIGDLITEMERELARNPVPSVARERALARRDALIEARDLVRVEDPIVRNLMAPLRRRVQR